MKLVIASDHAGLEMKNFIVEYLNSKNLDFTDLGTYSSESVNYPDYADKLVHSILNNEASLGILVCGTGIGISIRANRYKGIRAALLYSDDVAKMAKQHNNANVIVFGGRTMDKNDVFKRIDIFLETQFEGGRHQTRIDMLDM